MNILKIYSLIIIAATLIINLLFSLKENKQSAIKGNFLSFLLYLPVFIYLIKH